MDQTHSSTGSTPQKSSSFSSSRVEKLRDSDRNLSLRSLRFRPITEEIPDETNADNQINEKPIQKDDLPPQINNNQHEIAGDIPEHYDLQSLSDDIDQFLRDLQPPPETAPSIPQTSIRRFIDLLDKQISRFESGGDRFPFDSDDFSFFDSIHRASKLNLALSVFSSTESHYYESMNETGAVVHHAMEFLEDEFHSLLINNSSSRSRKPPAISKPKRRPSFSLVHDPNPSDQSSIPESPSSDISSPQSDLQRTPRLRRIAAAMIASGYETECCEVYAIARRNAMDLTLSEHGFDKISIDDVLRMPWDSLEPEISSWTKAFRYAITVSFPRETEFCENVFDAPFVDSIIRNLVRNLLIQFLTFAEAVSMTKRSAEKLFKVLDMHETLTDVIPKLDEIHNSDTVEDDIKMDLTSVRIRLGEAAVFIFSDLEISIKSDAAKSPVPGGAVHPLTRYVMNYLKYACEYKNTLEQVLKENQKTEISISTPSSEEDCEQSSGSSNHTPLFAAQIIQIMDLLNANLESKSKLYKDPALSNIFMMNNGRYMVQKIKGSEKIKYLLGESWCRKKSSDLRKYHKNYQRETWARVLSCFKDEGLQVKGAVSKPVLKERFKSFNAMFEEIHKTQSGWFVSDEQLQSELRVSVSAVVVPAYRSFLGRFSQYLDPGRQTEKYIKFGAEDLESYIDDLFDGNTSSILKRKT